MNYRIGNYHTALDKYSESQKINLKVNYNTAIFRTRTIIRQRRGSGDSIEDLHHQAQLQHQKTFGAKAQLVKLFFDIDTAIPLGLIVNELLTNAFKLGFQEIQHEGKIQIEIKEINNQLFVKITNNEWSTISTTKHKVLILENN